MISVRLCRYKCLNDYLFKEMNTKICAKKENTATKLKIRKKIKGDTYSLCKKL